MLVAVKKGRRFALTPFVVWQALEAIGFNKISALSVEQCAGALSGQLGVNYAINNKQIRDRARAKFREIFCYPIEGSNVILDTMLKAEAVCYQDIDLTEGLYAVFGERINPVLEILGINGYVRVVVIFNKDILEENGAWEKHMVVHELSEAVASKLSEIDEGFAMDTMHANPQIFTIQFLFSYVLGGVSAVRQAVEVQRKLNKTELYKDRPEMRVLRDILIQAQDGRLFADFGIQDVFVKHDQADNGPGPSCSYPSGNSGRDDIKDTTRQAENVIDQIYMEIYRRRGLVGRKTKAGNTIEAVLSVSPVTYGFSVTTPSGITGR